MTRTPYRPQGTHQTMVPSHEAIEQGLSRASERFATELAAAWTDAPDWTDFEWQMARAAAVLHGVGPLLAGTLRWPGPKGWQDFLAEQRLQTLQRQQQFSAALKAIDAATRDAGLSLVALKGAALHSLHVYAPGERPMADIDLLALPADAGRVAALLLSLGYAKKGASWKHEVFERGIPVTWSLPPGEHSDYPLKIELHERIAERLPGTETDITEQILQGKPAPGINPYPSVQALLLHLLLHATENISARAIRLIHMNDIARLAARMSAGDWDEVLGALAQLDGLWWALPPLSLCRRYQPQVIPEYVLEIARAAAPARLRRLCERMDLSRMSYASLRIAAFPALAWCRSPAEMAKYVRRRVLPNQEQRISRALTATEQWTEQGVWSRLSQPRRIYHWFLGRPPRQASMYIVRAVLKSPLQI